MAWDELTLLKQEAVSTFNRRRNLKPEDIERFCDYMEFVLCLIYDYGWKDAEQIVGIVPFKDGLDDKAVLKEIAGENFRQRVEKILGPVTDTEPVPEDLLRIVDTEAHRDYNTGVVDAGIQSGEPKLMKRWNTMMDNRVRDPHSYLEGVKVGLEDRFYTYTGESTLFPGGFGVPDLDINCRCWVTLERG